MAMTDYENLAKREIQRILAEQGYKTYAKILDEFDVNLTNDNSVVGYMVPNKAKIVINQNLAIDQVSMVVRHEILHQYLKHENRLLDHLADQAGLDPDKLDDMSLKELQKQLYSNNIFNIAADFEISNLGYTDADKMIARNLYINGEFVKGLVTEDHDPSWVNLSVEEMYDKLQQMAKDNPNTMPQGWDEQPDNGNDSNSGQSGQSGQENSNSSGNNKSASNSGSQDGENEAGENSSDGSDGSNDKQGKSGKHITIGSRGDKAIQQAEEAKRAANDISKELKKDKDNKDAQKAADKMDDIADKASQLVKDAKDSKVDPKKADEEDIAKRAEQIAKTFADAATKAKVIAEVSKKIDDEKISKAAKELERFRTNPITLFKQSLNKFIKNETDYVKGTSWSRFNKKYDGTGIIRPGDYRHAVGHIPAINVYFDQSGSWSDNDLKKGMNAIGALNNYVRAGQIKLHIYYFAINVYSSPEQARAEGGTSAYDIIRHIKETKPDNVIIMTDADTTSQHLDPVYINGGCWFLFKDGSRSEALINAIHAKKGTKIFDI